MTQVFGKKWAFLILHLRKKLPPGVGKTGPVGDVPAGAEPGTTACAARPATHINVHLLSGIGEKGAESRRPSPKLTCQIIHLSTHLSISPSSRE